MFASGGKIVSDRLSPDLRLYFANGPLPGTTSGVDIRLTRHHGSGEPIDDRVPQSPLLTDLPVLHPEDPR